jgi:hypothetical protein
MNSRCQFLSGRSVSSKESEHFQLNWKVLADERV